MKVTTYDVFLMAGGWWMEGESEEYA